MKEKTIDEMTPEEFQEHKVRVLNKLFKFNPVFIPREQAKGIIYPKSNFLEQDIIMTPDGQVIRGKAYRRHRFAVIKNVFHKITSEEKENI